MSSIWSDYVPEFGLRPQQSDALDQVWSAYERGVETVMLEAPTGVGKSIVQIAICRRMLAERGVRSFIVTPQRALQDQLRAWTDLAIMKGRAAYKCSLLDDGTTAAMAPCTESGAIRDEHPECSDKRCPFYSALTRAVATPIVVHNYMSLLSQAYMVQHFSPRGLLCMDEGHTAAGWVRNFGTFELTYEQVEELGCGDPESQIPERFMRWFSDSIRAMDVLPTGLSDQLKLTVMRAMAFKSMLPLDGESDVPWTAIKDDHEQSWSVIPLKTSKMSGILTRLGDKKMIVTATVLDKRLMGAELGLTDANSVLVRISSAFDPKNRPVVKRYVGSMSASKAKFNEHKLINEIVKIANRHRDEPGLIHTVSHRMSKMVVESIRPQIQNRSVECLPFGSDRDEAIRSFLSGGMGPNAILVGPSMMEGLDGKDDSCRWQVMAKVPWPSMGDPVVSMLMANKGDALKWANAWYTWKTAQQTVQGIGRVCRTPNDHGVTYLLDSGFQRILDSGYVPQYVLDALRS